MKQIAQYLLSIIVIFSCVSKGNKIQENDPAQIVKQKAAADGDYAEGIFLNKKMNGFQGIWYMNQPLENEYKFKYSGGLGTYCAKHNPFAIYRPEVNKTFFCYGGSDDENSTLYHMVSYFDHKTNMVARPTAVMDKRTTDAHDNPVLSIDEEGYIYLFSTSHGTWRPSYVHKSVQPYDTDNFEKLDVTKIENGKKVPMDNFSYMQSWYREGVGFMSFFTSYNNPADRTICFMTSKDGVDWSEWKRIAAIKKGHYQTSAIGKNVLGSAFNFHPAVEGRHGLNWRSNLYYVESNDFGNSWHAADGKELTLPLTEVENDALIFDYHSINRNVYLKDITYDDNDNPIILYITSGGFEAGPKNDPRTWHIAYWDGTQWNINDITSSDSNYDMGSLYVEKNGIWKIIAPTETGPQAYNPGGEMAMWVSKDKGNSWNKIKIMTSKSEKNHSYARRPINPHPDFYTFWADGNGRELSVSSLYISNQSGDVFRFPHEMKNDFENLIRVP